MQKELQINGLVDHFFRHESGRMISVLTKIFGSQNLDLAEDVVQDALMEALEHWQYRGVPDNPSAWLFRVAKNKALNIVNREKYKRQYATEVVHFLQSAGTVETFPDSFFSEAEIQDDQLRMMFTCCHPAISPDSQIALALKTLCGFSIPEIAKAFLTTEENISKRLVRARQNIRDDKIPFEVPRGKDLETRLQTVLEMIYLLFNEGYSASKGEDIIRYELCQEAIRLVQMLESDKTIRHKGNIYALLALMSLNASRFKARQDQAGNLLTMEEQDRGIWDKGLQGRGLYYLQLAMENDGNNIYLILAAISANYCIAPDYASIDWSNILSLYDSLLQLDKSPVVLLNRAIVISKVKGAKTALKELEQIKDNPSLKSYHLFYSTQAEFFMESDQFEHAEKALGRAIQLASLQSEKELLEKKLSYCRKNYD